MSAASPARSQLVLYGALALPLSFAGLPLYLHAPDFYATALLQPIAVLGAVLLALRVVDAVQDPLIGSLSDRYSSYRLEIILGGAALLLVGFAGLFNPALSPLPDGSVLVWFAVCVFLCTSGFSIVTINYQALGGLWKVPSGDRTKVTGIREAFGLLGILTASILPAVLQARYDPSRSFSLLSLALIPVFVLGVWLFCRWYRRRMPDAATDRPVGAVAAPGLIALLRDPWARRFYGVFFVSSLASAIPAVLVLFYIRDRLNAEPYTGLFLVIYFLSGAVFLPLWGRIAARTGKAKAWAISMVLAVVTFLWAFTLSGGDILPFAIICVLSGSALGADLAIPPAIVADRIDVANDRQRAARYFAANAFCAKSAFALATGLSLPALGLLGYQPGQPMEAGVGLSLAVVYALIPCLIKIASAVWLFRILPALEDRR
ncbi:MAG: MFS transporter [Alphaproteobacteria bacterium]